MNKPEELVKWFKDIDSHDVPRVGGKNASLGEMFQNLQKNKVRIPNGFATTAHAYRQFLKVDQVAAEIASRLKDLKRGRTSLEKTGKQIRQRILSTPFPPELKRSICNTYQILSKQYHSKNIDVAVRSSATAEDLPDASFAGQQESYLNIQGEKALLQACRKCFASLYTDRAISYREAKGFDHSKVALSIGIQKMVRSDKACSGVMFTIDTETGFRDAVIINGSWGLGENVVQGAVDPDEYVVFKKLLTEKKVVPILDKSKGTKKVKMVYGKNKTTLNLQTTFTERNQYVLSDQEILELTKMGMQIESHYHHPMDIEWAKDGKNGKLFIVQARPETVKSREKLGHLKTYEIKKRTKVLVDGLAIGNAITQGPIQVIKSPKDSHRFKKGSILVTEITSPDWVPIMKRALGIITDHGGRTSHAAIVSRELGVPAIVGTNKGTHILKNGEEVTLSCAEGDRGFVYKGKVGYTEKEFNLKSIPITQTKLMLNIASPAGAFRWWSLPCDGIGLARMEFLINNVIKIHPMALIRFQSLKDKKLKQKISIITKDYEDKKEYFVDRLSRGLAHMAASQYPHPVIVRLSDFKTNEYANLIGGTEFEPKEDNPMIGFRGASRYYSEDYRQGFALECQALKRAREKIGLKNIIVMVPFCRTPEEADFVLKEMGKNGLKRGHESLEVYVMAEIPSNIILAQEFAKRFDGFSIGTNDLTQLILGVDRDSEKLSKIFDERNEAVKFMICNLIEIAHMKNKKVGICGQAPSDHPKFADFLVRSGIDSISLNPDSVMTVLDRVARVERKLFGLSA